LNMPDVKLMEMMEIKAWSMRSTNCGSSGATFDLNRPARHCLCPSGTSQSFNCCYRQDRSVSTSNFEVHIGQRRFQKKRRASCAALLQQDVTGATDVRPEPVQLPSPLSRHRAWSVAKSGQRRCHRDPPGTSQNSSQCHHWDRPR